jgi:SPP1 family predicted phage head-tail adaptor
MGLRAGLLNRFIRIERLVDDVAASGQPTRRPETVCECWARVEPLGGREEFGSEQWVAKGDVRFTIRRRDDVNPLMQIVYGERVYDVVTVAEDIGMDATLIVGKARAEKR